MSSNVLGQKSHYYQKCCIHFRSAHTLLHLARRRRPRPLSSPPTFPTFWFLHNPTIRAVIQSHDDLPISSWKSAIKGHFITVVAVFALHTSSVFFLCHNSKSSFTTPSLHPPNRYLSPVYFPSLLLTRCFTHCPEYIEITCDLTYNILVIRIFYASCSLHNSIVTVFQHTGEESFTRPWHLYYIYVKYMRGTNVMTSITSLEHIVLKKYLYMMSVPVRVPVQRHLYIPVLSFRATCPSRGARPQPPLHLKVCIWIRTWMYILSYSVVKTSLYFDLFIPFCFSI